MVWRRLNNRGVGMSVGVEHLVTRWGQDRGQGRSMSVVGEDGERKSSEGERIGQGEDKQCFRLIEN